ncbi:MAG: PD-(D/E)XK nuclease-like domain-containing protein [Planctomycetes bacterium]|nr:PD-(D/E)XK nuclease-like domain-containing protein [Planctomycetota bacterium]
MAEEDYQAAEGLSCSGMKHLAVSPLNYWHHHLNPNADPRSETAALRFGKAAHCLGLEPGRFAERFALKLSADDFPGALVTTDDMKAFLAAHGLPKSAKRKQDLIDRIVASGIPAVIWDHELAKHAELNVGKTLLGQEESSLIQRAAAVLAEDPYARAALTGGMPEVSFFVREPDTGVMLKARMDYVRPTATFDLKTFSNSRGKPTDKAVFEAIYYENYHLQCVVYHTVRELARQQLASGQIATYGNVSEAWLKDFTECSNHGFGFVFIESSEPFDLRIVQLKDAEVSGAEMNVYWNVAGMQMDDLTRLYRACRDRYGAEPWREVRAPHVLQDIDIPQLMFS